MEALKTSLTIIMVGGLNPRRKIVGLNPIVCLLRQSLSKAQNPCLLLDDPSLKIHLSDKAHVR